MIARITDTDIRTDTEATTPSIPPLRRKGSDDPKKKIGFKHRPTFWYDRAEGRLVAEDGSAVALPERHELADVLDVIATHDSPTHHFTLWLLGGDRAANTPERAYFTAPVKRGWEMLAYQGGSAEDASGRAAQYAAPLRATIDVRLVASWFSNVTSLDLARKAYLRLWHVLRSAFGANAHILPTPAMTGLELLHQNLPFGREWEGVPSDLLRMLWAMPQGRIELFTDRAERHINSRLDTIPGLYNLDGVFMYASTLHELPTGRLIMDSSPVYWERAVGFYECEVQVPADWPHVGLVPHRQGERTWYPYKRGWHCSPGGWFATFLTSAEVAVCRRNNWRVNIARRYIWPDKQGDPLRMWGDKLKAVREAWALVNDPVAPLIRDGLRHVLLDPIGYFARHRQFEDGFVGYGHEADIPANAIPGSEHREENGISYRVPVTPSRYQLQWQHPEWACTVWGRTRARGAGELLKHPAESLIAYRVDGIWMTHNPGYEPSTHAGAWRLKYAIDHELPAPSETGQLLRLMRHARANGGLD